MLQQLASRSVTSLSLMVEENPVTASSIPFWSCVESQAHDISPALERESISLKLQLHCHSCAWNLSLTVTGFPAHNATAGCFHVSTWIPQVPCGALHKSRHDLCPKEFHKAVRCLAARKSPAIIHTLKIAGAKWDPAFQNQDHYVSAKYIIST